MSLKYLYDKIDEMNTSEIEKLIKHIRHKRPEVNTSVEYTSMELLKEYREPDVKSNEDWQNKRIILTPSYGSEADVMKEIRVDINLLTADRLFLFVDGAICGMLTLDYPDFSYLLMTFIEVMNMEKREPVVDMFDGLATREQLIVEIMYNNQSKERVLGLLIKLRPEIYGLEDLYAVVKRRQQGRL